MKFKRTNIVEKFEVGKVINKGAVSEDVVPVRSLHAPLKLPSNQCMPKVGG